MLKKYIIFIIITFIVLIFCMGCVLQDPKENPSYSVLPEVLIDYEESTEEIDIWVKSAISDFKYDSIQIQVTNKTITQRSEDNNTYCIYHSTKYTEFNLTIIVLFEEKEFNFQTSVRQEYIEEELNFVLFNIEDEEEEVFTIKDLPIKKVLEEFI